ncbi:hypothetical protein NHX12_022625, partial [Muraenolepis orangiensis]
VLKKTAMYCANHKIPFPAIDFVKAAAEPNKEIYVFQDEDNPEAPLVLHFPLVNLTYQKFKAPGVPRESEAELKAGQVDVSSESSCYTAHNMSYSSEDFDALLDMTKYNVLNNKAELLDAIRKALDKKTAQNQTAFERFLRKLVFPHLFLSLSLVGYAALGALMFKNIEGGENSTSRATPSKEYRDFLEATSIWLQQPYRWNFYGSMFFCCTVFTTVGYGEIYPVTPLGKVACVLYAMVGIPLMLLVISDVGDALAVLLFRTYRRIHKLGKALCYRSWSPGKAHRKACEESHRTLEDGTFVFSHHGAAAVASRPLDLGQVLQSQADLKQNLQRLNGNKEIFERILARENFLGLGPLKRTVSCPELDRMARPPKGYAMWDFSGIGDNMEGLDVPFVLILLVVVAYILLGGLVLPLWETQIKGIDPFYFCFITLTTIGFGDIVPQHPKFFMVTSLFIITGMAIMSMAFKLGQTRIVSFYRHCIRSMSRGHAVTMRDQELRAPCSPKTGGGSPRPRGQWSSEMHLGVM